MIKINDEETYSPGSLMKVPLLIAVLKVAERTPSILDKKVEYQLKKNQVPKQTITGPQLVHGKFYTIRDLLRYMVVYSDNAATSLIIQNLNDRFLKKEYTDLQLPDLADDHKDYTIRASEYSRFLRVLYNGSYLKPESSHYALELLTQSTYKDGLVSVFGDKVKIAHKFGERCSVGVQQYHEFGIVYLDKGDYLLGIMTKGKNCLLLYQSLENIGTVLHDLIEQETRETGNQATNHTSN